MAVLLVAFTHAVMMIDINPQLELPFEARWLDTTLAPIRMPLMMLFSGMLLNRSLSKPTGVFVMGKIRHIAYPFAVWTGIMLLFHLCWAVANHYQFRPPSVSSMVFPGIDHLWYLQHLLIYYLIARVLRAVPALLIALVALAGSAFITDDVGSRFLLLMAYFFLGSVIAERLDTITRWLDRPAVLAVASASIPLLFMLARDSVNVRYDTFAVPLTLCAMLLAVKAARMLLSTRVSGLLEFAGRNSIVFYLLHWIPVAITVELLMPLDIFPWLIAVAATGAAALSSWGMVMLTRRSRLAAALFALPPLPRPRWLLRRRTGEGEGPGPNPGTETVSGGREVSSEAHASSSEAREASSGARKKVTSGSGTAAESRTASGEREDALPASRNR